MSYVLTIQPQSLKWLVKVSPGGSGAIDDTSTCDWSFCINIACECNKKKQILLHKVRLWVFPPPHSIPTTEPAFIEQQSTIFKPLSPAKILGQKAKSNH